MTFFKTPAVRRFTATVAAAATALALMTAAAVPARAGQDSDDMAKALAALAAIAFIGTAINSQNDNRRPDARVVQSRKHGYQTARRVSILPAQCAVHIRGHRLSETVYPEKCLRRAGIDRRLPQRCEVTLQGRGHGRTAYEENCLLNSGFQNQGRRRH